MEFIEYFKCSTCKKAKKFLDDRNINYIDRDIISDNPSYEEIKIWIDKYSISVLKLFNTSGLKYRELKLKDKLKDMEIDEIIKLLASDGMLVKRPIVVSDKGILIGFKEKEWVCYFEGFNN